jgi:hypothetical protein
VVGSGPLPHHVPPRRLPKAKGGVHRQLGRLVCLDSEVADICAMS